MRRLRSALVLAALAVLVVGVAVLAVADPFHLRHIRWFTAGSVLLAVLLATAAFAVLAPRGLLRAVVLVLGVVAALGWVGIVAAATHVSVESRSLSEVTDGDRRLVVVEATSALDPVYAVVVRSGGGAFEQETVVYQGVESAPPPASVRFVDPDTVEILTGTGCTYRSEVEAVTLDADPVHRPLRAETC